MTTTPRFDATALQPEPDYEFLDPARIRLSRDDSGRPRLVVADERCYWDVRPARAFPTAAPDTWIALLNRQDRVIGMVRDPAALDPDSRGVLEEALRQRYFTPIIDRIDDVRHELGVVYFQVQTDRGARSFVVRGLRDSLEDLGNGHVLFSDVDSNRYRIPDWRRLDRKSRRYVEGLL